MDESKLSYLRQLALRVRAHTHAETDSSGGEGKNAIPHPQSRREAKPQLAYCRRLCPPAVRSLSGSTPLARHHSSPAAFYDLVGTNRVDSKVVSGYASGNSARPLLDFEALRSDRWHLNDRFSSTF